MLPNVGSMWRIPHTTGKISLYDTERVIRTLYADERLMVIGRVESDPMFSTAWIEVLTGDGSAGWIDLACFDDFGLVMIHDGLELSLRERNAMVNSPSKERHFSWGS